MANSNQERIKALESGYNQLANQTDLMSKHIDGIQAILKNILDFLKVDPAPKYKPTLGDVIQVSCEGSVVDSGLVIRFDNYGVTIGRFNTSYEWKTKKIFYEDNFELDPIASDGDFMIRSLVDYDL